MKPLDQYLNSIEAKVALEANAEIAEHGGDFDEAYQNIRDAYAEGFCDDQSARMYGDYPYDGSFADQGQEDGYLDEVGELC